MTLLDDKLFMFIDAQHVFYAGIVGKPRSRRCGAYCFYVGLDGPIFLTRDDALERHDDIVVTPPYAAHSLRTASNRVIAVGVEQEAIAPDSFREWAQNLRGEEAKKIADRVRALYCDFSRCGDFLSFSQNFAEFNQSIFGAVIEKRMLEPRIARIVAALNAPITPLAPAESYAKIAQLSLSRFLHLFKAQTGATFRNFRAWKRARSLLYHVNQDVNLAYLAQTIGYPDSSHFSHSIRRYYGLQPRALFVGSRELNIIAN